MPQHLSLQRFMDALTQEVYQFSLEELRQKVLDHAKSIAPSQRADFAEAFTREAQAAADHLPTSGGSGSTLLADISDLREGLERGDYFSGYGWDEDIYDERSYGDESWADEMTALFAATSALFSSGDLSRAREAYEELFSLLALDEEVGYFSGPTGAADMLDLDLALEQTQYLRCVYELAPEAERASAFAEAWFSLTDFSGQLSLQAVDECRMEQLPGMDQFLPGWIAHLKAHVVGRYSQRERELLVEATLYHGGLDGLGDLARSTTVAQAELYLDWMLTLQQLGQEGQAIAVALEALAAIAEPGATRAMIADQLVSLSADDPARRLEAQRQAFRSAPTLHRLVALFTEEASAADPVERMGREVELLGTNARSATIPLPVQTALLLLAGQVQNAVSLVSDPASPGGNEESRQRVLLPYLLVSGLAQPHALPDTTSWLALLMARVDQAEAFTWHLRSGDLTSTPMPGSTMENPGDAGLAGLLMQRVVDEQLGPDQRTARLQLAEAMIQQTVEQIVGHQQRSSYDLAANLIVSRLEAGWLNGEPRDAEDFAAALAGKFPRHRAFQKELVDSRKRSKVLTR